MEAEVIGVQKHRKKIYNSPPHIIPLSFGAGVLDEGVFGQVSCIVTKGDQPLKIFWSFHGNSKSSELGITTMLMGPHERALLIPSVGH